MVAHTQKALSANVEAISAVYATDKTTEQSLEPKRRKTELRRTARELREEHADDAPESFLAAMRARPEWTAARVAMLYLPFGVEPPTADLADDFRARGGTVCVPVWDAAAGRYALAELPAGAAVAPGFGGIPEPVGTRRVDPASVDLFVLPGLLFDRHGTRLGHGRGHLDRLLAARRPGAAVLGLAFPWQVREEPLPREPHDVPADAVLLPDGSASAEPL